MSTPISLVLLLFVVDEEHTVCIVCVRHTKRKYVKTVHRLAGRVHKRHQANTNSRAEQTQQSEVLQQFFNFV